MVWDDYEFARFVSTNLCPPITYYFLHLLCERNLVDSIVTTNYDMYWESVCTRIPTKKYQVVVYPRIQKNKIKSDTVPKGEKTVRFWKIHGSFNILYHPECEDAIVHPPTVIGAISPYFLHKLCKNRYPDTFHDYPFSKGDSCGLCRLIGRTGPAIHFTDAFSPQRNPFRLLMKEALTDFLSPGRGMILSVGFRCGITEELRPIILRLATTTVPIVMFLHEEQQKLDRPLLERIERNPLSVVLHGVLEENLERFLRALFFRIFALGDTEWRKLVEGYRNWQGQQYFMYKIF